MSHRYDQPDLRASSRPSASAAGPKDEIPATRSLTAAKAPGPY
jgi:hypothetical protein